MFIKEDRNKLRKIRHARVRKKISGTKERPRLGVYRSSKHIYAQIIDDVAGHTLVSASTLDPEVKTQITDEMDKKAAARLVGKVIAQKALAKGINKVAFDRGGYMYHGRVEEVALGAREAGLEF